MILDISKLKFKRNHEPYFVLVHSTNRRQSFWWYKILYKFCPPQPLVHNDIGTWSILQVVSRQDPYRQLVCTGSQSSGVLPVGTWRRTVKRMEHGCVTADVCLDHIVPISRLALCWSDVFVHWEKSPGTDLTYIGQYCHILEFADGKRNLNRKNLWWNHFSPIT